MSRFPQTHPRFVLVHTLRSVARGGDSASKGRGGLWPSLRIAGEGIQPM